MKACGNETGRKAQSLFPIPGDESPSDHDRGTGRKGQDIVIESIYTTNRRSMAVLKVELLLTCGGLVSRTKS